MADFYFENTVREAIRGIENIDYSVLPPINAIANMLITVDENYKSLKHAAVKSYIMKAYYILKVIKGQDPPTQITVSSLVWLLQLFVSFAHEDIANLTAGDILNILSTRHIPKIDLSQSQELTDILVCSSALDNLSINLQNDNFIEKLEEIDCDINDINAQLIAKMATRTWKNNGTTKLTPAAEIALASGDFDSAFTHLVSLHLHCD
jgi:hypothetical protein